MKLTIAEKCKECKRYDRQNCIGIEVAKGLDLAFCKLFIHKTSDKNIIGLGFQAPEKPKRNRKKKGESNEI